MSRASSRAARAGARKRLSQNFLADADIARRIVRSAGVGAGDLVLEIGPGDGMLTAQLLGVAGRVLAYEIDARYAARLQARYAHDPRIDCYHKDFRDAPLPDEPFGVVANVPFGSTTDIVRWCLAARQLTSATLLTQREFARKHTGDYGRWSKLTVTHWPTTTMHLGARIDRWHFRPVPRVDGALLHLRRRPDPLLAGAAARDYRRLVELGFTGVGGSLAATLATAFPPRRVRAACAAAGIPAGTPVGLVAPERWFALYRALRPGAATAR